MRKRTKYILLGISGLLLLVASPFIYMFLKSAVQTVIAQPRNLATERQEIVVVDTWASPGYGDFVEIKNLHEEGWKDGTEMYLEAADGVPRVEELNPPFNRCSQELHLSGFFYKDKGIPRQEDAEYRDPESYSLVFHYDKISAKPSEYSKGPPACVCTKTCPDDTKK